MRLRRPPPAVLEGVVFCFVGALSSTTVHPPSHTSDSQGLDYQHQAGLHITRGVSSPRSIQLSKSPESAFRSSATGQSPNRAAIRSEEHTSELQSQFHLVC